MAGSRDFSVSNILKLLNSVTDGKFITNADNADELKLESQKEGKVEDMLGNQIRQERFDRFLNDHVEKGSYHLSYMTFFRGEDRYMQCEKFPVLKVIDEQSFFKLLLSEKEKDELVIRTAPSHAQ